jgi:hypothetical protein
MKKGELTLLAILVFAVFSFSVNAIPADLPLPDLGGSNEGAAPDNSSDYNASDIPSDNPIDYDVNDAPVEDDAPVNNDSAEASPNNTDLTPDNAADNYDSYYEKTPSADADSEFSGDAKTVSIIPKIAIGLLIALFVAGVVIHFLNRHRRAEAAQANLPPVAEDPAIEKIAAYITENMNKGYAFEQIREVLLRQNFSDEMITKAYYKVRR